MSASARRWSKASDETRYWAEAKLLCPALVPLLPSGADAAACHLTWDDQPLLNNEGTFFEIAGVYRHYHCPISRTVYLGKPSDTFLNAEKMTLEGMEAGARAEDVAIAFCDVLERYGIKKENRVGYSVGCAYQLAGGA